MTMLNKRTLVNIILVMVVCFGAYAEHATIVFVIAENEYEASKTLPEFAKTLEDNYGFSCEILQGGDNNIPGMNALKDADLAVIYVRRQPLPQEQLKYLRDYVESGKPIIGIRTASHAFALNNERPGSGLADWPEFDADVLGGNYDMHLGNKSDFGPYTYVRAKPGMESHPILYGVPKGEFKVASWLYKTSPLAKTAEALMMGRVGDIKPHQPVAWTNINTSGGRVFYTSLGHQADFKMYSFCRLLTNGIFWALDKPSPSIAEYLKKPFNDLRKYKLGDSRKTLSVVEEMSMQLDNEKDRKELAGLLGDILAGDSTTDGKRYICRQLRVIGNEEQIPVLAEMLADEELTSIARFALEKIDSPKRAEVLRNTLMKVSGKARAGIADSLGTIRDADSVEILGKLLSDSDQDCVYSAAMALGKIANKKATQLLGDALKSAPDEQHAVLARAYLLCADNLRVKDNKMAAAVIYEQLYNPDESTQIRMMALKGLVKSGKKEVITVVLESLQSDEPAIRGLAVRLIKNHPNEIPTSDLVNELKDLPEQGQIALIHALTDRGDAASLHSIVALLQSDTEALRLAALESIGKLGDSKVVGVLIGFAAEGSDSERSVALKRLGLLQGDGVNEAITRLLQNDDAGIRIAAVKTLVTRTVDDAAPALVETLNDSDEKVRIESWKALRALGTEKELSAIIALWLKVEVNAEIKAAEDAIVGITRNSSSPQKTTKLLLALRHSPKTNNLRISLLRALGRIGDSSALPALREGLENTNPDIKNEAIRALSSWPTAEPLQDLKNVMENEENETSKILATRGYITLIRNVDGKPGEVVKMYEDLMNESDNVEIRKMVLSGLSNIDHIKALNVVEPWLKDEDLKEEAGIAAVTIADEIKEDSPDYVRKILKKILDDLENEWTLDQAEEMLGEIEEF